MAELQQISNVSWVGSLPSWHIKWTSYNNQMNDLQQAVPCQLSGVPPNLTSQMLANKIWTSIPAGWDVLLVDNSDRQLCSELAIKCNQSCICCVEGITSKETTQHYCDDIKCPKICDLSAGETCNWQNPIVKGLRESGNGFISGIQ